VPIVLKSGSLKLLEPSGLVQACNGIALPLYLEHILRVSFQRLLSTVQYTLEFIVCTQCP